MADSPRLPLPALLLVFAEPEVQTEASPPRLPLAPGALSGQQYTRTGVQLRSIAVEVTVTVIYLIGQMIGFIGTHAWDVFILASFVNVLVCLRALDASTFSDEWYGVKKAAALFVLLIAGPGLMLASGDSSHAWYPVLLPAAVALYSLYRRLPNWQLPAAAGSVGALLGIVNNWVKLSETFPILRGH